MEASSTALRVQGGMGKGPQDSAASTSSVMVNSVTDDLREAFTSSNIPSGMPLATFVRSVIELHSQDSWEYLPSKRELTSILRGPEGDHRVVAMALVLKKHYKDATVLIDSNDGDILIQLLLCCGTGRHSVEGILQLTRGSTDVAERVVRDTHTIFADRKGLNGNRALALNACFVAGLLGTDYSKKVPIASARTVATEFFKTRPRESFITITTAGIRLDWNTALHFCYRFKPSKRGAHMGAFFAEDKMDSRLFAAAMESAAGNAARFMGYFGAPLFDTEMPDDEALGYGEVDGVYTPIFFPEPKVHRPTEYPVLMASTKVAKKSGKWSLPMTSKVRTPSALTRSLVTTHRFHSSFAI